MIEKQQVEYKSIWKKDILEEICGAANAKGGKFLIGKDNNGKTVGLSEKEIDNLMTSIPNQIVQTMRFYDVTVDALEDEDGMYIEIDVQKASHPVFYQGKMFKRIGSSNFLVEGAEQQTAIMAAMNQSWDSKEVDGVSIADLDEDSFNIFKEEAVKAGMLKGKNLDSPSRILEELELTKNGKLTTAAVLLFHKQPSKIISGAKIEIGKMRNDGDVVSKEEIKGSLMQMSRSIMEILQIKYLYALISYDGVQRIETLPYPFNALREAVFNSLMHNDWSSGQPIQIKVYDHKLSISNRSILGTGWTVENHTSRHINPLVSNTFSKAGLVEKFGTGISKMFDACEEEGNPIPQFRTSPDGFDFSVTFEASNLYLALEKYREKLEPKGGLVDYRKVIDLMNSGKLDDPDTTIDDSDYDPNDPDSDPEYDSNGIPLNVSVPPEIKNPNKHGELMIWNGKFMKWGDKFMVHSNTEWNVFDLIKENPRISYSQMAKALNVSRKTIARVVARLRENGFIQFEGKPRNGEWKILKEYPNE